MKDSLPYTTVGARRATGIGGSNGSFIHVNGLLLTSYENAVLLTSN